MKKISTQFFNLFSMLSIILLLLGNSLVASAQEKKQVMTTFYPVYYLAERIGGDAIEVSMLLEGNQNAHDYEASAKDAARTQSSDLFIYQDDEMEYFVSSLFNLIDLEKVQVLETTVGIELLAGDGHDHEHEDEDDHEHEDENDHEHEDEDDHDHDHSHDYDPHTWLDPMVYAQQAANVRDALIELDPANEAVYQANAEVLISELEVLNQEFEEQLAQLEDRRIVVQHAAFGYLTHAYDLEQVAIAGISSTQEPSAQALASMQNFIKSEQISVVYVEPSLDQAIANTVTSVSDVELRPLRTLETVSADEMAEGIDYFSIMRDNLVELMR